MSSSKPALILRSKKLGTTSMLPCLASMVVARLSAMTSGSGTFNFRNCLELDSFLSWRLGMVHFPPLPDALNRLEREWESLRLRRLPLVCAHDRREVKEETSISSLSRCKGALFKCPSTAL